MHICMSVCVCVRVCVCVCVCVYVFCVRYNECIYEHTGVCVGDRVVAIDSVAVNTRGNGVCMCVRVSVPLPYV